MSGAGLKAIWPRPGLTSVCVPSVRTRWHSALAVLAAGLLGITPPHSLGGEARHNANGMPHTFDVATLNIRMSLQPGNAVYAPRVVHLSGGGSGAFTQDGKQSAFPYSATELVALLNTLYEIRFFDLPADYSTLNVAQLGKDGTVSLTSKFTSSATGNSVCITAATFEKCVRYGPRPPAELNRIVQHVFAEAERLAAPQR